MSHKKWKGEMIWTEPCNDIDLAKIAIVAYRQSHDIFTSHLCKIIIDIYVCIEHYTACNRPNCALNT